MHKDRDEMQDKVFDMIQQGIVSYLGSIPTGEGVGNLSELMEEFINTVEFTEHLHINVMMSAIGTALANAKEMAKLPEFQEDSGEMVFATKRLFANCKRDILANMDKRLAETLQKTDTQEIWDKALTHNEQVAQEILRETEH